MGAAIVSPRSSNQAATVRHEPREAQPSPVEEARSEPAADRVSLSQESQEPVDQALEALDSQEVELTAEDFTAEQALTTWEEQQELVDDLMMVIEGKACPEGLPVFLTDPANARRALPFALIYLATTQDMLVKTGDLRRNEDGTYEEVPPGQRHTDLDPQQQRAVYGIMNGFHKYWDVAQAESFDQLDEHWQRVFSAGDGSLGGNGATGLMHSLMAHVVGDLDRAMAHVMTAGVETGAFSDDFVRDRGEGGLGHLFNTTLAGVFAGGQALHSDTIRPWLGDGTVESVGRTVLDALLGPWVGEWLMDQGEDAVMDAFESWFAGDKLLEWRSEAFDRGLALYETGDVDAFLEDHQGAVEGSLIEVRWLLGDLIANY